MAEPSRFQPGQEVLAAQEARHCIADACGQASAVSLELVLADTDTGASQSLGLPAHVRYSSREHILRYSLAAVTRLEKFDEIRIIFHRNRLFMDRSVKVDILRFLLSP